MGKDGLFSILSKPAIWVPFFLEALKKRQCKDWKDGLAV